MPLVKDEREDADTGPIDLVSSGDEEEAPKQANDDAYKTEHALGLPSFPHTDSHTQVKEKGEYEEDEGECCPVSEEVYEEKGPNRPLVLPHCGHTFSRATIENLLNTAAAAAKPFTCPICTAPQPSVLHASACPPNWDSIKRLACYWVKTRRREPYQGPEDTNFAAQASNIPAQQPDTNLFFGYVGPAAAGIAAAPQLALPGFDHTHPVPRFRDLHAKGRRAAPRLPQAHPANRNGTASAHQEKIVFQLPRDLRCASCGKALAKALTVRCKKQPVPSEKFQELPLVRYRMRCPDCSNSIWMTSNTAGETFRVHKGATEVHAGEQPSPDNMVATSAPLNTGTALPFPVPSFVLQKRLDQKKTAQPPVEQVATSQLFNASNAQYHHAASTEWKPTRLFQAPESGNAQIARAALAGMGRRGDKRAASRPLAPPRRVDPPRSRLGSWPEPVAQHTTVAPAAPETKRRALRAASKTAPTASLPALDGACPELVGQHAAAPAVPELPALLDLTAQPRAHIAGVNVGTGHMALPPYHSTLFQDSAQVQRAHGNRIGCRSAPVDLFEHRRVERMGRFLHSLHDATHGASGPMGDGVAGGVHAGQIPQTHGRPKMCLLRRGDDLCDHLEDDGEHAQVQAHPSGTNGRPQGAVEQFLSMDDDSDDNADEGPVMQGPPQEHIRFHGTRGPQCQWDPLLAPPCKFPTLTASRLKVRRNTPQAQQRGDRTDSAADGCAAVAAPVAPAPAADVNEPNMRIQATEGRRKRKRSSLVAGRGAGVDNVQQMLDGPFAAVMDSDSRDVLQRVQKRQKEEAEKQKAESNGAVCK